MTMAVVGRSRENELMRLMCHLNESTNGGNGALFTLRA